MSSTSIHRSHKSLMRLDVLSYASRFWAAIDTPLSLSCYLLAKYGEHKQLVEKSIRPQDYDSPSSFYSDYQSVKLLSRYPNLRTGVDTAAVAYKKFVECEDLCFQTNERFRGGAFDHLSDRVRSVFVTAQRKISLILGDVPSLEQMSFSFGPGSSYGVRGDTSVYKKVSSTLECTHAFLGTLPMFLEEFPGWVSAGTHDVSVVPGSQLTVVPKNAKTDRPICIEPLLNGLYQKGVGSWIRDRLKRFGINLDDQGVNQKLASLAIDRCLATVDFASASDTISYGLVLDLLPIEWFQFLDVARSPRYEAEGRWYSFQKFSSMGNAYTFELETLIFYALACASCEVDGIPYETSVNLSVYGDDVIIPRDCFALFQEASEVAGFRINVEKTFTEGQFFESCGHDYFMGHFVRPILLSKEINTLPSSFYAANTLKRFYDRIQRVPIPHRVDRHALLGSRLRDCHAWVVGCIPPWLRAVGPEGYGDGHLIGAIPQGSSRHPSWDGWYFHTLVERPSRVKLGDVPTAYALYFARGQSIEVKGKFPFIDVGSKIPAPPDNGKGYSHRSHLTVHRVKTFCNFTWQDISW